MEIVFYIAALVAIATTIRVVTCANAVHALLYLIVSLMAVAVDFYVLGAPFAATLEVIVYAGAIMVLFVFVVMMLSINETTIHNERKWLTGQLWIGPGVMAIILLTVVGYTLVTGNDGATINGHALSAHAIGMNLFGPYVLVVELVAFVLLAALVVAAHLGRQRPDRAQRLAENGRTDIDKR
ncbi:NADH-quinone oxidoreductase subunit J [Salinisphaera sp. USBA-960]|uniref:NADH-quinone oxidoreductase subunit J n=1 Tax=Salinisphaera orenii TaxID=856731 RepID=UPI000DBE911E|nr:NADH-quinone oxidoreductase subunit J [Salifodinibacter halophilus]NNC26294.1 NADH-quinone oxidoreductase subunit J [Salifodinibacter halophilus]